jgi:hypothetical protein
MKLTKKTNKAKNESGAMEHEMSGGESRRWVGYKIRVTWVTWVLGLQNEKSCL